MCNHLPACPTAAAADHAAAQAVSRHPDQGWTLLCNGVVVFEDLGELLPDGLSVPAQHLPSSSSTRVQAA